MFRLLVQVLMLISFQFSSNLIAKQNTRELVFTGVAPQNTLQPRLIIPILTESFRRMNIKFSAVYRPSLRSLVDSNSGLFDGELHRVYDFARITNNRYPNLVRVESKLLSVWLAAFVKKDFRIETWQDLSKYNIIYYRGRKNVERMLSSFMPANAVSASVDDLTAFRMLSKDRADVVIAEERGGQQIIDSHKELKGIKMAAKLEETKIYTFMHKKHNKLAIRLAQILEEMKLDGSFRRIMSSVLK